MITYTLFLLSLGCPNIQPTLNLNTTEYLRSTWFIQQQQITGYQPKNALFCVAQTLELSNKSVPFYEGTVISVYNYGNLDKVNGQQENLKNVTLCARQVNQSDPGRILNAPCFIPNFLAGPYWVLAAGPSQNNYTWAIISGGPPNTTYPDGNCSTKLTGTNGSGLWLFTRYRYGLNADNDVNYMREFLENMGITTSQLLNVEQEGCNYQGAYIK
jgi:hypothetical protein